MAKGFFSDADDADDDGDAGDVAAADDDADADHHRRPMICDR